MDNHPKSVLSKPISSKPTVLIIGGGVIGVITAYYLAKENYAVTLLERNEVAAGSSYGNAGLICPTHSTPLAAPGVLGQGLKWLLDPESPFYIKPTLDPAMLLWLWRFRRYCRQEPFQQAVPLLRDLHRSSLQLYAQLITDEDLNCYFGHTGSLTVFREQAGLRHVEHEMEILGNGFGLDMKLISGDEARQMEPRLHPDIQGALFSSEDAHMDPALFVRGLAQTFADQSVSIHTQTEVLGFEVNGRHITRVQTTRGDFEADEIVLAAGAWSAAVTKGLKLNLPLQPAKGYSITLKQPEVNPLHYHIHCGESRVAVTPLGPKLRFAGTMELAGFDDSINQRRVKSIRRAMGTYFTGIDGSELVELWRGYRPVPPDGLPYIGRSKRYENLMVATGHSYLGVSLGAVTGKIVTQLFNGETPIVDTKKMNPERF